MKQEKPQPAPLGREAIAQLLYDTRFPHRHWKAASLSENEMSLKQADAILARTPAPKPATERCPVHGDNPDTDKCFDCFCIAREAKILSGTPAPSPAPMFTDEMLVGGIVDWCKEQSASTPAPSVDEQPYVDMLWNWFEERADLSPERRKGIGLTADDFRIMLDDHEAALEAPNVDREAVIEECAKVCNRWIASKNLHEHLAATDIAKAIRALAGTKEGGKS